MKAIVVGYDGSEAARRALFRAEQLGGGAALTVVSAARVVPHAGRGGPTVDAVEAEDRAKNLAEARSILASKGKVPRIIEGHGDPAEAIVKEAEETGADLVVVGTRGHGLVGRALMGSVSTKVLHHAPCDVLVVR
jgi:nucleotide-binding universal stress UspA family protein